MNEDTLTWEEITSVSPGGHFLYQPSTLKFCRDGYRSRLLMSPSREDWIKQGGDDYMMMAQKKAREFWQNESELSQLDEPIQQKLQDIVNRADNALINNS